MTGTQSPRPHAATARFLASFAVPRFAAEPQTSEEGDTAIATYRDVEESEQTT
jgi:hypothetical protein